MQGTNTGLNEIAEISFEQDLAALGLNRPVDRYPSIPDPRNLSLSLVSYHRELLVRLCNLPKEQLIRILDGVDKILDHRNTNIFEYKLQWSHFVTKTIVFKRERLANVTYIDLK